MQNFIRITTLSGLIILSTACDKINDMFDMPKKMDNLSSSTKQMGSKMDTTNENIRLQKLLLTVQDFSKKENFDKLNPVPVGILVSAEKFSEAATEEEIVKFTYVQINYINKIAPAERIDNVTGKVRPLTAEEQMQFLMEKYSMLTALKAVAALTPDQTINDMIQNRIYNRGEYMRTALAILAMRADFLSSVILKQSALDTEDAGFDTVLDAEKAIRYQSKVDVILHLPFRKYISAKTSALYGPDKYDGDIKNMNINLADPATVKSYTKIWSDIRRKTEASIKMQQRDLVGNAETDRMTYLSDIEKFKALADYARAKEVESTQLVDSLKVDSLK